MFTAQNEHLCGTPYQGSFSNIEPFLRVWTGQAGYEDIFHGLVRSELQAIALHILSKGRGGPNTMERAGKTISNLAIDSRSLALAKILLGRRAPIDATDFDTLRLFLPNPTELRTWAKAQHFSRSPRAHRFSHYSFRHHQSL